MNNIFNIRKRKQEKQTHLVGAYMPDEFVSSLTLHCLSKGISKSCIIQEILQEWYNRICRDSEESSINEIIRIIQYEWNIKKKIDFINASNNIESFSLYKRNINQMLSSKKIKEDVINEILEKIEI